MYFDDRVLFTLEGETNSAHPSVDKAQSPTMRDIMKPIVDRVIVTALQRSGGRLARMHEGQRLIGF